ncbi:MAG: hypothetical protein KGS60_06550 [Verrucomicrobia bacterium]|nr:hypothetical protein [Verrucomicrobiota bacterium]
MKNRLRLLVLSLLSAVGFALVSGCETTPKPYDNNFSTLPQNRPQSWEGSAGMGGAFAPQSM